MTTRCEELIATLTVPRPFDVDVFLTALAEQRSKRIKVVRDQLGVGQPCGMLISTTEIDYIYCVDNVPALQAQHTVMHEVGHLLLEHLTSATGYGDTPRAAGEDVAQLLLPTLSPALVRRVLGRTAYASEQEREAELFASLVLSQVSSAQAQHDDSTHLKAVFGYAVRCEVRQAIRQLTPLWRRLAAEFPQVLLDGIDESPLTWAERAEYRLYRRVLEIRDTQLLLRPHIPPEVLEWALATARVRGLDPVAADVLLEAAALGAALDAHRAGLRHHRDVVDIVTPRNTAVAPDVLTEARWLIRVAAVLRSDPDVAALRDRIRRSAAANVPDDTPCAG